MKVLVCGAEGFLGRHIAAALRAVGHTVIRGVHRARSPGDVVMDYRSDLAPQAWLPRLAGIDAVVNAVGILREAARGDFDRIHHRAPAALFAACASAGVRRVVQISALGCADTPYLASKHAADAALRKALPEANVLRPGLVFGRDGASTRFFLSLASLPLQLHPAGAGAVQPVHVDDVAHAVCSLVDAARTRGGIVELPGPRRLSYSEWLATYRAGLGLAPALILPIPTALMSALARLAGVFPRSMLSSDTWAMLRAGNTGNPAAAEGLMGRPLRPPEHFISGQDAELLRLRALAQWRTPLTRTVLALIWIASATVSAGIYPVDASLAMLSAFGLSGAWAIAALAAACALDLMLGVLTLFRPGRRLWIAQLGVVAAYTVLVALRLPAYLIHPFAPILKNLAVAVLLLQLWAEEPPP